MFTSDISFDQIPLPPLPMSSQASFANSSRSIPTSGRVGPNRQGAMQDTDVRQMEAQDMLMEIRQVEVQDAPVGDGLGRLRLLYNLEEGSAVK